MSVENGWTKMTNWTAPLVWVAAAAVLSVAAAGDGVLPGDVTVTRWVQGVGLPGAEPIARFGSWVGSSLVLVAAAVSIALALLFMRRVSAGLFMVGLVLAKLATPGLKAAAESPRPGADFIRVAEPADGFGFPSGHVLGVVLIFGGLIVLSSQVIDRRGVRWGVQLLSALVMLATGFARVYDGVHWPSDVVGGYLWGGLMLFAVVTVHRRAKRAVPAAVRPRLPGLAAVWSRRSGPASG